MLTLVIDTATAACSVALFDGEALVARNGDRVGRGHAERLLPMIAALPAGGRADHILVDVGPGSFTGIRVGIAAARALALGWGAGIGGYSSLANVAAAAFAGRSPASSASLAVVLEGGHGEVFMQRFLPDPLRADTDLASLAPEAARGALEDVTVVGDGLRRLAEDPRAAPAGALPDAADALRLPLALRSLPPRPLYGRAPDAKPAAIAAPRA